MRTLCGFRMEANSDEGKNDLDKKVALSLCSLAPAQSQMHLFLGAANFNQSEDAMSRVTASAMFLSGT